MNNSDICLYSIEKNSEFEYTTSAAVTTRALPMAECSLSQQQYKIVAKRRHNSNINKKNVCGQFLSLS